MKLFTIIFLLSILITKVLAKNYDFEFRNMDLKKVITSLAQLDGKSVQFSQSVGSKPIDVSLKNISPSFAMQVILESYGYVAIKKDKIYQIMSTAERGPMSTPMVIIPMKNVLAEEIEANIKSLLRGGGEVSVNKQMNALIVSAPDDIVNLIRATVEKLDKEVPQVFIEGKIIETTTTFARSLGLEWRPTFGQNELKISNPGGEQNLLTNLSFGLGDNSSIQAKLMTGERDGDIKIISEPKITTINGVSATIESTMSFNIRTLASTGSSTTSSTVGTSSVAGVAPVGGVQTVSAGLTLVVTPYIVSDEKVRLTINISKSDPDFSNRIDGIPGVSDNKANTSLVVKSGQMASIGGLLAQTASDSMSGVPFLRSIPIIGVLFGNIQKEKKDKELMIFLTPRIYKISSSSNVKNEEILKAEKKESAKEKKEKLEKEEEVEEDESTEENEEEVESKEEKEEDDESTEENEEEEESTDKNEDA